MKSLPTQVVYNKEDFEQLQKEFDQLQLERDELQKKLSNRDKFVELLSKVITFQNITDSTTELSVQTDHIQNKTIIYGR